MGLVVQFAARKDVRKPKPDRPCEVTIFPGVRYDRLPYGARPSDMSRPDADAGRPRLPEETAR